MGRCAIGVKAPGFLTMTNASQKSNVTYAQLDGGGAWTQASDRRLKEEIEPLEDLLERARPLEAVTFYYKGQDRERHPERQLGYIAQDVAEVFPQLVVDEMHGDDGDADYDLGSVFHKGAVSPGIGGKRRGELRGS